MLSPCLLHQFHLHVTIVVNCISLTKSFLLSSSYSPVWPLLYWAHHSAVTILGPCYWESPQSGTASHVFSWTLDSDHQGLLLVQWAYFPWNAVHYSNYSNCLKSLFLHCQTVDSHTRMIYIFTNYTILINKIAHFLTCILYKNLGILQFLL